MKLTDIARLVGGEITGSADAEIERVAKIEEAVPGDITFLSNLKYKRHLSTTNASAVLLTRGASFEELTRRPAPITIVSVSDPYKSFLILLDLFNPAPKPLAPGIHPTAVIASSAQVSNSAAVGAHVTVGERSVIAEGAALHSGTVIGDDVRIGKGSLIYANVTIREGCTIGDRVIIHSGTVIGSDGFGFTPMEDGTYEKIPQRGTVIIEEDVEIGANCAIDRATIGATIIRRGAKLDNLIQVAHNVVVGEDTVIAAQTGISGSTKIGKHCAIAGQVGLTGHIEIADNTTIGAQSGVPKSITKPGKIYFGYPARELSQTLKIEAALGQLPELLHELRKMQKKIEELDQIIHAKSPKQE